MSKKEDIAIAVEDYLEGSIATTKQNSEALYHFLSCRSEGEITEALENTNPIYGVTDLNILITTKRRITGGLTIEDYIDEQVKKIKEKIIHEITIGDTSKIKLPQDINIRHRAMDFSEKKLTETIIDGINAGLKAVAADKDGELTMSKWLTVLSFLWPGLLGMTIGGTFGSGISTLLKDMFIGYCIGSLSCATIVNIPILIKITKEIFKYYKDERAADEFVQQYLDAIINLEQRNKNFEGMSQEIINNFPHLYPKQLMGGQKR